MRKNVIQIKSTGNNGRTHIENDWYPEGLPRNIELADTVYIDTSYGFASFNSQVENGLDLGEASGCYGIVSFVVSEEGKVSVGQFTVLNSTTIICNKNMIIGDHCMLAWGSVITDSWLHPSEFPVHVRRQLLNEAAHHPLRSFPFSKQPSPVIIEDNCWVGFDAVIMPGVRLGHGCVVGCKSIITQDVPPYAVVTGSPAKIVKYLRSDDTEQAKAFAFSNYKA